MIRGIEGGSGCVPLITTITRAIAGRWGRGTGTGGHPPLQGVLKHLIGALVAVKRVRPESASAVCTSAIHPLPRVQPVRAA